MGRAKKTPWNLTKRERSRVYQVEFRHRGRRYRESTGSDDPREAATEAARIYVEIVSGRRERSVARKATPRVGSTKLDVLFSEWLASLANTLDVTTVRNYEMYVTAHLLPFFQTLDRITTARCSDYTRTRLAKVMAGTVRKEQSALRGFLAWCIERGHLVEDEMPIVKSVPKKATGTANDRHRKVGGWIGLTSDEAHAIIAALPERGRKQRPVRAYFKTLWETGLRPETLCSLKAPTDYRRGGETLRIRDEADKARYGRELPLTQEAREALDSVCPDAGYLFPRSPNGAPPRSKDVLRKAAHVAGLEPDRANRISPYDFRHGRATELAHKTDLVSTGYLLGHRHATTTDRYIHSRKQMAERALQKLASAAAAPSLTLLPRAGDEGAGPSVVRFAAESRDGADDGPSDVVDTTGPGESLGPESHDFGHTLATLVVSSESAARPLGANSAESPLCEEQDLNLHALRHRNLKVETPTLKH